MPHPSQKLFPSLTILITWSVASFFAFFQFFLQSAASVLGTDWMRDFHLDTVTLGSLSSAFFYAYALMQIPVGILYDRYSPRYLMTAAALVLTVGNFLLAYTDNYYVAFVARMFMGFGSSFGFVGLLHVCARHFPPKRFALMVGISEGLTMLGVMLGVMLLAWLVAQMSWRITLFGSGVITFFLMLATFFLLDEEIPVPHEKQALSIRIITQQLKIIFTHRQVILGSVYGFFMFAIVNAFTSLWGVAFLINTHPISRQLAANLVGMVFIGIAVGGPLSGWLSKVMNQHRIILISAAALATLTMSIIIFCPQVPSLILFILLFLMGMFCSSYMQCFAVIKDAVPSHIQATALASSNMMIMLGAPILQLLIGWLLQNHFLGFALQTESIYRFSLGILPAGMFIAFLLAFFIKEQE